MGFASFRRFINNSIYICSNCCMHVDAVSPARWQDALWAPPSSFYKSKIIAGRSPKNLYANTNQEHHSGGPNILEPVVLPSAWTFKDGASSSLILFVSLSISPKTAASACRPPFDGALGFFDACSRRALCRATRSARSGSLHFCSFFLSFLTDLIVSGCGNHISFNIEQPANDLLTSLQ